MTEKLPFPKPAPASNRLEHSRQAREDPPLPLLYWRGSVAFEGSSTIRVTSISSHSLLRVFVKWLCISQTFFEWLTVYQTLR